ncbi:hypothetical protein HRI_003546100 [Hibiscus trionum]|uniref:FAF domain-containing protein n=1 Tax=Hibiscus trionum TaxID=183268 RepID=A0A9W7IRI4_HIBTR|nr:hypothetical protein HRI_003546100 [Hibiscus trionum]
MFSSACQGLQLCLEPRVVESHFLRLKLAPSAIILSPTEPESMSYDEGKGTGITNGYTDDNGNGCKLIGNRNTDVGGWNFLQSFACPKNIDRNEVYVHPLVKRSASILSEKSLDMCTESLGSETGSDISNLRDDVPRPQRSMDKSVTRSTNCSSSFPPLLTSIRGSTMGCKPRNTRRMSSRSSFPPPLTSISGSNVSYNPSNTRRTSRSGSFPPPLTSISGSNGVQVTSHREGGRLVLQAVSAPTCHTYMHAERSEGRLRLCLLKDSTPSTPIIDDQDGNEVVDEEGGEANEEQSEGRLRPCHSEDNTPTTPIFDNKDEQEREREREEIAEEDEVEEEKCHWGDEGMNVKSGDIGGRIGMGKLARPSSCKERRRHKGLLTLEPYLVAT